MTFVESVEQFLATADWLTASHAPSVAALKAMAVQLDAEVSPAMLAQFGAVHRFLIKEKPRSVAVVDPLEQLLRR